MGDGYRDIPAEFGGHCPSCHTEIKPGDTIWWAPSRPALCADCGPDAVEAEPPAAGGTRSASMFERETGAERTAREEREAAQLHREESNRRLTELESGLTAARRDLGLLMRELGVEAAPEEA